MKKYLFLLMAAAFTSLAKGETMTLYYFGESITINSESGVSVRSPYLLARTSNPTERTISEKVITKSRGTFGEFDSTMKIENNHFTMTESTGTTSGEGELTGEAWNWTFLRGEFKAPKYGMRIVDYNFFADPKSIMAHKDFYMIDPADGKEKLVQQEDAAVFLISKDVFEAKRSELLGR